MLASRTLTLALLKHESNCEILHVLIQIDELRLINSGRQTQAYKI
jgi:hypothetical protein